MEHPVYPSVYSPRRGVWLVFARRGSRRTGERRGRERERVAACQDFPFLHAGTIIMIVNFARSETYACTSRGNEKQAAPVTLLHTGSPTLGGGSAFVAWIHRCLLYGLERSIKSWVTLLCPPCASGYASTRSLC